VSVKNPRGGHVAGLTRDQFQIRENGVPQKITEFASGDVPVAVGLVMDNSGSMGLKRAGVIEAGVAFAEASNPLDQMFVVSFNDTVKRGLPKSIPFTGDIDLLRKALSMHPPEGKTSLYDAVAFALKHLESARRDKKALVVVSDGGDNASKLDLGELMRLVEKSAATIYTIGIFDGDDPDRNPGVLKRIANVSGGECLLPGDLEPLLPVCQRIARDIRSRYTIGYVPVRTTDKAATRRIQVTATSPEHGKLVVRTRTRYRLPERTSQVPAAAK
jgi:Ca-activated chloride channel homolog